MFRSKFEGVPEDYLSYEEKFENSIKESVEMFSRVRRLQEQGKTTINNYRYFLCFIKKLIWWMVSFLLDVL